MNPVATHFASQPWHLLPAALVEPHDGGPHRIACWPQRHKGFPLVGDRQGGNALGGHLLEQLAQRLRGRRPPVLRILLIAVVTRAGKRDGSAPGAHDGTILFPRDRFGGGGAAVYADNSVFCGAHVTLTIPVSATIRSDGNGRPRVLSSMRYIERIESALVLPSH